MMAAAPAAAARLRTVLRCTDFLKEVKPEEGEPSEHGVGVGRRMRYRSKAPAGCASARCAEAEQACRGEHRRDRQGGYDAGPPVEDCEIECRVHQ
jgi:hypothetical protein